MQEVPILFLRHRDALQHQHNRTARRTHVDWLVGRIQHQHRRMQRMTVALLMHAHKCGRLYMQSARAAHRIVPLP